MVNLSPANSYYLSVSETMMQSGGLSQNTLYANNLDDKKNPEVLKKALWEICVQFGEMHDIIAMKV